MLKHRWMISDKRHFDDSVFSCRQLKNPETASCVVTQGKPFPHHPRRSKKYIKVCDSLEATCSC